MPPQGPDGREHVPVTREEVDENNPNVIAAQLRALNRAVDAGFEMLDERIKTLIERLAEKVADHHVRLDDHAEQLADLKRHKHITETRLAALEAHITKGKP